MFDTKDPTHDRTGRLQFLAGWELSSDNDDFGGYSSMLVMPDNRFFLLSDAGVLLGFTLDEANDAALRPFIAPLPDGPAKENVHARKNWDAESVAYDPGTGRFWVGYEQRHSIWRYAPSFARKEASRQVKAMQHWPMNGGPEAMLRITAEDAGETQFLLFSEAAKYKNGGYEALIFNGDPVDEEISPVRFGYQPPKGYNITAAALLPDGRALLLFRRFTPLEGVSAILSIASVSEIKPGEVWTSTKIATLKPPIRVDNMEALAVTQEGNDIIIWIASDDNFISLQDTILMKFRLLASEDQQDQRKNKTRNEKAGANPGFSSLPH